MPAASPSPSSSSRSSVTPPPQISIATKKKSSKKDNKGKKKSVAEDPSKNEGVDLNWAYAPPPDAVLINGEGVDAGEFDWDAVNNDDDLELWLIRVPESVKPKYLENLKVEVPSSSKSACIGTIKRKHTTFDIWSVGNDDSQPIGGEEIKSLSCLLPRKSKKGKLYPAPKPIAYNLVVAAQAVIPTPNPSLSSEASHTNPPRFSYPQDVLKHKYIPYGFLADGIDANEDERTMDVDIVPEESQPPPPKKKHTKKADEPAPDAQGPSEIEAEVKSTKGKKRKGDVADVSETPAKKTKKSKVA
ncbi:hypothetical protein BDZ97DRAFT_1856886 [Flammula alnicola]|nr:hypothetical protein BDZ97DRAFT_1856886 [Flammula alnicola]